MPLMSGRELAKRVQSIKPTTKVVYMSGYTDDTLAFHGFPQLNTGFIQKPFTVTLLAEKVERCCRKKLVIEHRVGVISY